MIQTNIRLNMLFQCFPCHAVHDKIVFDKNLITLILTNLAFKATFTCSLKSIFLCILSLIIVSPLLTWCHHLSSHSSHSCHICHPLQSSGLHNCNTLIRTLIQSNLQLSISHTLLGLASYESQRSFIHLYNIHWFEKLLHHFYCVYKRRTLIVNCSVLVQSVCFWLAEFCWDDENEDNIELASLPISTTMQNYHLIHINIR